MSIGHVQNIVTKKPYLTVKHMSASLLWYDLETFGIHPKSDRIAQFAAIRTDSNFQEVEAPHIAYCRLGMDYLPNPESCLITKLTPGMANERGIREADFARLIHESMSVRDTCVVGYNNIHFDDEFIRVLFYRNFYDPYEREYANGNSRWDIIDLLRMAHDLRPDGIEWVYGDGGKPVFRLQDLASANNIEIDRAHEALSDVRATIALAQLIYQKQRKLFNYFFDLRLKKNVRALVNLQHAKPITYTSRLFTSPTGCTTLVLPISAYPDRENTIIAYDLRHDPRTWLDLPVDEIRKRVFTPDKESEQLQRMHFARIHLNRSPAGAPLSTLDTERANALAIDVATCHRNAGFLTERPGLAQKIRKVFSGESHPKYQDPDYQIYSGGFFGDEDRSTMERVRTASAEELISTPLQFHDPRGSVLFRRYLARNFYELLSGPEKDRWKSHCAAVLLAPESDLVLDLPKYKKQVSAMLASEETKAEDKAILSELKEYGAWIEEHVLS